MKSKYTKLTRLALTALAAICMCSSVLAGPDPAIRFIKINGQMMKLEPMTEDVALGNGCTVCTRGVVTKADGQTVEIKEGELVTADGEVTSPLALHAHGG